MGRMAVARGEDRRGGPGCALRGLGPWAEGEGHRAFNGDFAVDAGDAVQHAHPAAQAADDGLDFDDVAGVHGPAVAHPLDPRKERQALPVLGLGEDQNRADLGNRLGQNRRRERRQFTVTPRSSPTTVRSSTSAPPT